MSDAVLFVNYDAGNMTTGPHRDRILRHIQNNYRRRDRQEKALALRTSAKIPTHLRQPKQPADVDSGSPSTALTKGNSDPFHALAVPISAEENRIVSFYRDFLLPDTYNIDGLADKDVIANVYAKADWEFCIAALHDPGTAQAFIASNASLIAIPSHSTSLQHKALALRSNSMAILRKKLTDTPRSHPLLWWHIAMLWTAEIAANNGFAARVHGDILSKLVQKYFDAGGTLFDAIEGMEGKRVLDLLLFVIWPDSNMATLFLMRPSFDVYEWLPKIFAPFLEATEPLWLSWLEPLPPLDPVIDSEEMTWCFEISRQILAHPRARKEATLADLATTVYLYQVSYRWTVRSGKLISRYCVYNGICESASEPSQWQYAQQYLALGALRWRVRSEDQNDTGGKALWSRKILDALRSVLERSKCTVGCETWNKWKTARLWAFYMGAIYEPRKTKGDEWHQSWFKRQFARQARAMELKVWGDVSAVLSRFLFNPAAYETGQRWVEKALQLTSSHTRKDEANNIL